MTITIIIVLTTNAIQVSKDKDKKLLNYEKIRTVGKGAFGAAVLYRKKDDGLMVVIKVRDDACDNDKMKIIHLNPQEINMLDLSAVERQMALNEVSVSTKKTFSLGPFFLPTLYSLIKVRVLATLDHLNIVTYYDRLGLHCCLVL